MTGNKEIREAIERSVKAVTARPSVGQSTAVTRVKLRPGLSCDIEDGPWKFTGGMTDKYGGSNAGPNPGVFGRAALGSCLAIGYAMWAARMDVAIDSLSVEVHADYDVRGELGVETDVRPGYLKVRYVVTVESSASKADVMRVLDKADRHSAWLDDISHPVPVERELRLVAPES